MKVRITSVDIPFIDMVALLLKAGIALIPVALIFGVITGILGAGCGAFGRP